jgi:diguanylate cyclase (GGDEF)-like protein/putative nucleotidyltransferase with HDIG domain
MRFRSSRGSGGSVAVLVILVAIVPLVIAALLVQNREEQRDEDRSLTFEAAEQSARLEDLFARSRSLTQILAQNPAFGHVYEAPGALTTKVTRRTRDVREANEALAHLEKLFPGQIGEACFIDVGGAENARAVKGRIARLADLSHDETKAPFFRPAFALDPGEVHQSRPYVSPDTDEWVVASAAPIPAIDGVTRAIVHFELTIESFRRIAARASQGRVIQIVDARNGRILLDTRYMQRPGAPLAPKPEKHSHAAGVKEPKGPHVHVPPGKAGTFTTDGKRAAFRTVSVDANNLNDWIVIARSTHPRAALTSGSSAWLLALLAVVIALIPLVFASWRRSQDDLRQAAMTDALTGLGNRRALDSALTEGLSGATVERPMVLALYDLDGFKLYNDTFGHSAGDALLARLGARIAESAGDDATAFRMGGDEFCLIAPLPEPTDGLPVAVEAAQALRERGEGFEIEASFGVVLLPTEADTARDALRLADERMYAQKGSSRTSASRQSTDVLLRVLSERDADLGAHVSSVAQLAEAVARRLRVASEEIQTVSRAAALHDIGKLAIPESILQKPGALDEAEWAFIRSHTVVGERIVAAAPALTEVARLVRSSHEAWNGSGYPDGLRGDEIPLGARIVATCDAFEAMISARPYRAAMTVEEALAEIRRCAGTQFDPAVAAALCDAVAAADAAAERRAA